MMEQRFGSSIHRNISQLYIESIKTWLPPVFSSSTYTWTDFRQGVSMPNWKQRIRSGDNATTAFAASRTLVTRNFIDWEVRDFEHGPTLKTISRNRGTFFDLNAPPDSNGTADPDSDDLALKLFYRAIDQTRTQFAAGTFVGELRETMKMIGSPAKALRTGIGSYLSSVPKRLKGVPKPKRNKVLSESYLEYSFGWAPLVNDVQDAIAAFRRVCAKKEVTRITRVGKRNEHTPINAGSVGSFDGVYYIYNVNRVRSYSVRYIGAMRTQAAGAIPINTSDQLGFTLLQFVPTVWNLLPYSFLIDYFTNIGDIIEAGATVTNDLLWVCRTVRNSVTVSTNATPNDALTKQAKGQNSSASGGTGTSEVIHTSINRSPLATIPKPAFRVSLPGNPVQWINMGALIAQGKSISSTLVHK